jgi:ligand-binding SRPBCC domain-containing protein
MALFQFYREQEINAQVDELWDFISLPQNLKRITPNYMGFEIDAKHLSERIYPGMIIPYRVSPLFGIKMNWVTEITHLIERELFVDEQRVGPYKMWHHEHKIMPINKGTLMTDLVTYRPPLGLLGRMANNFVIKRKLNEIFDHRKDSLIRIFGSIITQP